MWFLCKCVRSQVVDGLEVVVCVVVGPMQSSSINDVLNPGSTMVKGKYARLFPPLVQLCDPFPALKKVKELPSGRWLPSWSWRMCQGPLPFCKPTILSRSMGWAECTTGVQQGGIESIGIWRVRVPPSQFIL